MRAERVTTRVDGRQEFDIDIPLSIKRPLDTHVVLMGHNVWNHIFTIVCWWMPAAHHCMQALLWSCCRVVQNVQIEQITVKNVAHKNVWPTKMLRWITFVLQAWLFENTIRMWIWKTVPFCRTALSLYLSGELRRYLTSAHVRGMRGTDNNKRLQKGSHDVSTCEVILMNGFG